MRKSIYYHNASRFLKYLVSIFQYGWFLLESFVFIMFYKHKNIILGDSQAGGPQDERVPGMGRVRVLSEGVSSGARQPRLNTSSVPDQPGDTGQAT